MKEILETAYLPIIMMGEIDSNFHIQYTILKSLSSAKTSTIMVKNPWTRKNINLALLQDLLQHVLYFRQFEKQQQQSIHGKHKVDSYVYTLQFII